MADIRLAETETLQPFRQRSLVPSATSGRAPQSLNSLIRLDLQPTRPTFACTSLVALLHYPVRLLLPSRNESGPSRCPATRGGEND